MTITEITEAQRMHHELSGVILDLLGIPVANLTLLKTSH